MRLIEENGLRILECDLGYLIHQKNSDFYATKLYLGINASLDDFEEVEDESIPRHMVMKMQEIESKEESLNKIGKIVANQVTDDAVALDIQEFYDNWAPDVLYSVGQYIRYNEVLYKVLQQHTSQSSWTPDVTASLYAKVLIDPSGETIPDWVQPDSTNAYMTGDKVKFEGEVYVSLIDNNIWSPATYPAGWQKVEG